ncbi:hypothetical protein Tco_0955888 [Tanacetum coccineum]|uniref:FRIGIDA-like protein n=1 Tax=Tanacetum coccineum TaxID=301880 RepID=A0ABQ5E8G2_9ASTR
MNECLSMSPTLPALPDCRHIEEGESSGAMFKNLQDDYSALAETHEGCSDTVRKLVTVRQDLEHNANLYTNMFNLFKELKEEHLGCDRNVKALERERKELSVANKNQATRIQELEADCLSEPFNMAIQAGWGKGLSLGCIDKEILAVLKDTKNFDAYSIRSFILCMTNSLKLSIRSVATLHDIATRPLISDIRWPNPPSTIIDVTTVTPTSSESPYLSTTP